MTGRQKQIPQALIPCSTAQFAKLVGYLPQVDLTWGSGGFALSAMQCVFDGHDLIGDECARRFDKVCRACGT